MKKLVTKLLCGVMLSSVIFCGCGQVTGTTASSEIESQTTATTPAETEPAPTETGAKPEINVDNMVKVSELYASKQPDGTRAVPVISDNIRGKAMYDVSEGALNYGYYTNNGSYFRISVMSGKRVAKIRYDFVYKDKHITGEGDTAIDTFEKLIDDIIADRATYIDVFDKSAIDEHTEDFKKDLPIVYSRFIALSEQAFPELGLKLEDVGLDFGTKYRTVDPVQPTTTETVYTHDHKFKNGFCTDCKKAWTVSFYDAVGKTGGMTGKGWRTVYGQQSSTMFSGEDYVQYSSTKNNNASLMYFKENPDDAGEQEAFFIAVENTSTKKKQKMTMRIEYRLEMKKMQFGKGVVAPKYTYWVVINTTPAQSSKVFESKESLKKYAKVDLFVANKKGFGTSAWGKKANIEKLKKSFEADGCTYYTKDQVIDRLWEQHENYLASLDHGMIWMNLTLADIGLSWKKD
jgi:hypothetical protein